MTTKRCVWCYGTGRYADPMTNWDAVPCERCKGTGSIATDAERARAMRLQLAGEHAAYKMLAELGRTPLNIEEPAKKLRAQLAALSGKAS